jgi:hypothetical protein
LAQRGAKHSIFSVQKASPYLSGCANLGAAMNLIHKLEKPLGWMAIGNLPLYVVAAQAILFIWGLINPEDTHLLSMDPLRFWYAKEYWRILTFLFVVPFQHPLLVLLSLYFQYVCGQALEEEWGSFPLTMFYLLGAIGAISASFIVGHDLRNAYFFNESIFLAFAALYPDFSILLFFVLPLKVKWLGWFTWAIILVQFFSVPILYKIAIFVSLAHYFVFFGKQHLDWVRDQLRTRRR